MKGYFANLPEDVDFRIQFYADGYAYTSKGFFEVFPVEVAESETAAGNIPFSGDIGEFAELPGQTVTGVSRLDAADALATEDASGNSAEPAGMTGGSFSGGSPLPPPYRDPSHGVEEGGGSPIDPGTDPDPEPVNEPKNDRFVMHTGSSATT